MSRPRIVCVLLALATFLLYSPTRHDQFLNYDDNNYVTDNPIVEDGRATTVGLRLAEPEAPGGWVGLAHLLTQRVKKMIG